MNKFGEKIYPILKSMNMTFIELSERTDIPTTTLHRYFNGDETKIPNYRIERIAEALNIKPSILVGWDESSRIDIKLEIQKINLIYLLMTISDNYGSIVNYLSDIYKNISARGWSDSNYFIHNETAYINRFQSFYNKNDLITYEEQNDLNTVIDFVCPDLNDSSARFKLNDIISFIQDPYSNWLIGNIDNTVRMVDSFISAYRDLHLYRIIDKDNVEYVNKAINDLNKLMHDKEKEFITNYDTELNNFLSVKYAPVKNFYNSNSDNKMNELINKLDKFFELFSELDRNGIFEDLNKLNPDDRTMVYSLIKRLEEKNNNSNEV